MQAQERCVLSSIFFFQPNQRLILGQNNTTLLTCAMFTVVTSITNATNCGNQQQQSLPAGKTRITESYGLIKK
jgi:hypothetical protein